MMDAGQVKRIAQAAGVNPYYVEKEYIQHVFLKALYATEKRMVFKGGTCLRICYKFPRYSEDLDFNADSNPQEVGDAVKKSLEAFGYFGVRHSMAKEEAFEEAYSCRVRVMGPLYEGTPQTENSLRIEAGRRGGTRLAPEHVLVSPVFPGMEAFFVKAMEKTEILAEKTRAMFMRSDAKDWFDAYALLQSGVQLDAMLARQKLAERGVDPHKIRPKAPTEKQYTNELQNLVPDLPPHTQVVAGVAKAINRAISKTG